MKILLQEHTVNWESELQELSVNYPEWEFFFTDVDTLDITNEHAVDVYFKKQT
jgi:dTDP-4-dehydrorhamnose reductase